MGLPPSNQLPFQAGFRFFKQALRPSVKEVQEGRALNIDIGIKRRIK